MNSPIITVDRLAKAYRIGLKERTPDTLISAVASLARSPWRRFRSLRRLTTSGVDDDSAPDTLWALRDVSFEVAEGEVLGVIGRNGAGKSTLLKILSRITEPTSGRAVIHGRVSSLLEVGTGFHPELTGRENVYLNGTILGMTKREIDRKFAEIVDFSGVEKFLDTPIKRYSSGMTVRLAFAVAAHLEPEILIVDEVLAVGDAEFQKKCIGKMRDVARGGRTVLFVSHNLAALGALCQRGIVLSAGMKAFEGPVEDALRFYSRNTGARSTNSRLTLRRDRAGSGVLRFTDVTVSSASDDPEHIAMDDDIVITLRYEVDSPIANWIAGFHVVDKHGVVVYRVTTLDTYGNLPRASAPGELACTLLAPRLMPGEYSLTLLAYNSGRGLLDQVDTAVTFDVAARDVYGTANVPKAGIVFARCAWRVGNGREG
jgi:lipopolysaccharide transport system ATP-binding protein